MGACSCSMHTSFLGRCCSTHHIFATTVVTMHMGACAFSMPHASGGRCWSTVLAHVQRHLCLLCLALWGVSRGFADFSRAYAVAGFCTVASRGAVFRNDSEPKHSHEKTAGTVAGTVSPAASLGLATQLACVAGQLGMAID